jgi:hypothetical protein
MPPHSTLFGVYINELDEYRRDNTDIEDGCLLHHVLIAVLMFTNVVVLSASSFEGYKGNSMP